MSGCCSHGDFASPRICSPLFSPARRHSRAYRGRQPKRGRTHDRANSGGDCAPGGIATLGRTGRVAGTRELVIPGTPYIVPDRVKGDVVQIITILHGAQQWPDRLP